MDFPIPLTNPPRQKTTTSYQADIGAELLTLRARYGATITITPFKKPHLGPDHVHTLGDPPVHADLTITLFTADGHTITRHTEATHPSVLSTLKALTRGEELVVCGTPRPERVGQRFRPRTHTCGAAYPRRQMPHPAPGEVWRCQECDTKHATHSSARQRRRH